MPEVTAPPKPEVHAEASPEKITWGPITAVLMTVVLFVLSQVAATIIIILYAHGRGLYGDSVTSWLSQTWPEFIYIALVEAITLSSLWLFIRHYKANFRTLGLIRPQWRDLGYALIGFAVYFGLLIAVMAAVRAWFPDINLDQKQQVGFDAAQGKQLILVFTSLVILPPVTEEIVARGFLYLGLRTRLSFLPAAIMTSLIFASAHLQFGSGEPLLWTAAIDTFVLSLVLVWLREKTGALWAPITVHVFKNLVAFLVLFIFVT